MSDIKELQRLALVSKVMSELDNHLGFSEKALAEFIIHLGTKNTGNEASFQHDLKENGAEFPDSFARNLLRIITAMMNPSSSGTNNSSSNSNKAVLLNRNPMDQ